MRGHPGRTTGRPTGWFHSGPEPDGWTWRWLPALGGAAILGLALVLAGPGAVPDALGSVDAPSLLTGTAIGAVTTTCAAWRWQVVARHLGTRLSVPTAVGGCYRAQFLNATLPGGLLGDVWRGVGHGRAVGEVGLALRAVAWERTCGYVVLVVVTLPVLVAAGASRMAWSAVPTWAPATAAAAAGGLTLVGLRWLPGLARRLTRLAADDVRALAAPGAAAAVLAASVMVIAGHVATFGLATHAVGVPVDGADLVAVALVVLLIGALPLNLAGWGPREGAAAWAFAGVGLGASEGLSVAVVYGVIALVATLPGAGLLLLRTIREACAGSTAHARGGAASG